VAASPELQAARQELARLDGEIARAQAARSGIHLRRQLAELEPSRAAAGEKQASAQGEQARAASALEAKSAELARAKEAASQARAKADKELSAAKSAEAEAAKSAASTKSTLDESLGQFWLPRPAGCSIRSAPRTKPSSPPRPRPTPPAPAKIGSSSWLPPRRC
jgi:predicted  nucleic acid-binding Zn-ribbon protein